MERRLACPLACLLVLGWAPAAAAGGWSARQVVSDPITGAVAPPSVGIDDRGDAVVASNPFVVGKVASGRRLELAVRRAGGRWRTLRRLSPDGEVKFPRVAVNARGYMVLAWRLAGERIFAHHNARVWIVRGRLGGALSPARPLPKALHVRLQVVGIDGRGRPTVAWLGGRAGRCERSIWAFGPDGRSRALRTPGRCPGSGPRLAVAPDGTAILAWTVGRPGARRLAVATRAGGRARFGAPIVVRRPGVDAALPGVAAASGGGVGVAWRTVTAGTPFGGRGPVVVARGTATAGLGRAVALADAVTGFHAPAMVLDRSGGAAVIWEDNPGDVHGTVAVARLAAGASGATSTRVLNVDGRYESPATQPALAADAAGDVVAAFRGNALGTATAGPEGGFVLDRAPPGEGFDAALAVSPGGRAIVAWREGGAFAQDRLVAATRRLP